MLELAFERGDGPQTPGGWREVCLWKDGEGIAHGRGLACGATRRIEWPGLGVFQFSLDSSVVRVWPEEAVGQAAVERDFRRMLEPIVLQALGWQALHASAVQGAGGVLGICGVSKSGKSTLAFALGRHGLPQFADDALVVSIRQEAILADPRPFAPRLRTASRQYFNANIAALGSESGCLAPQSSPLVGVVVLSQDADVQEAVEVRPVSPTQAFRTLLTHAHSFDASEGEGARRLVTDYLELAHRVPVYSCVYKPGLEQLPALVAAVEATARDIGVVAQTPVGSKSDG